MMRLARFICGAFAVVAIVTFVGLLTIDRWLTIGERGQGGYPERTPAEEAEVEARAKAAEAEAIKAAEDAWHAVERAKSKEEKR